MQLSLGRPASKIMLQLQYHNWIILAYTYWLFGSVYSAKSLSMHATDQTGPWVLTRLLSGPAASFHILCIDQSVAFTHEHLSR
jgi:hypothetical protein